MSHTPTSKMSTAPSGRSTASHKRYASLPTEPTHGSLKPQQHSRHHRDANTNGHERSHSSQPSRHSSSRPRRHHHHHRRSSRVRPDIIDQLDDIEGGLYHHEGPYDAACRERNSSLKQSPIDALKVTNEEALKATPHENVMDSITKRRPLDGVAYYPPGSTDRNGQMYNYDEGYNMMTEDRGNFRRWPGVVRCPESSGRVRMYANQFTLRNSATRTSKMTLIISGFRQTWPLNHPSGSLGIRDAVRVHRRRYA